MADLTCPRAPSGALHVLVAAADPLTPLRQLLGRFGHDVRTVRSGRQLVETCRASPPDLVVLEVELSETGGDSSIQVVSRELAVPVILVSDRDDIGAAERAEQARPAAFLVKPVREAELKAAIDLAIVSFARTRELAAEVVRLRRSLDERKLLERARALAAKRLGFDGWETLERMRRLASDHNLKVADVARSVLDAEEVFGALEHHLAGRPTHARPARRRPVRTRAWQSDSHPPRVTAPEPRTPEGWCKMDAAEVAVSPRQKRDGASTA